MENSTAKLVETVLAIGLVGPVNTIFRPVANLRLVYAFRMSRIAKKSEAPSSMVRTKDFVFPSLTVFDGVAHLVFRNATRTVSMVIARKRVVCACVAA